MLALGATAYHLADRPPSGRERPSGPLLTDDSGYINTFSADVGEVVSYGWPTVANAGTGDLVLESAELIGPAQDEPDAVLVRGPETVPVGDLTVSAQRG